MAFKNMFKKSSKLFDREGFYIILFVCLCIVAITAVYISRYNANMANRQNENPPIVQQEPDNNVVDFDEKIPNISANNDADKAQTTDTSSISTETATTPETSNNTAKKDKAVQSFKMIQPVEGTIEKGFDKEELVESKTMNQWETHEGIDIACELGTGVKAAESGRVIEINKDDTILHANRMGFGVTVVIDHGNGILSYYCNLSEDVKVKINDKVKKGNVIGVVGDTSVREAVSIEGSHLHFTVKKKVNDDYVTVNPLDYIK